VQAGCEVSVAILSLREWKISVAGECTESEGSNTLRAVGGLLRKSWVKSLRESEFTSSEGIVPFVHAVGTDPGEARTGRSFGAEKSLRRRTGGQDPREGFAKSR
jgi:hypothetical protein